VSQAGLLAIRAVLFTGCAGTIKEEAAMNKHAVEIRSGIVLFRGEISRHLLIRPMVSNAYLLENGDVVILFDPSCGKEIAGSIEAHVRSRRHAGARRKRAFLVAGHSHIDHAGNFYLSDVLGADESHVYVHERGLRNGRVINEPRAFIEKVMEESRTTTIPTSRSPSPIAC